MKKKINKIFEFFLDFFKRNNLVSLTFSFLSSYTKKALQKKLLQPKFLSSCNYC